MALTLGRYLAEVRKTRRMTLRQAEEATEKVVSNAYLSQIENEKVQQPSPTVLHALAEIYGLDFADLMERAGHIRPTEHRREDERHGRLATFTALNMTPDEEEELVRYLQFIRSRRPPSGEG